MIELLGVGVRGRHGSWCFDRPPHDRAGRSTNRVNRTRDSRGCRSSEQELDGTPRFRRELRRSKKTAETRKDERSDPRQLSQPARDGGSRGRRSAGAAVAASACAGRSPSPSCCHGFLRVNCRNGGGAHDTRRRLDELDEDSVTGLCGDRVVTTVTGLFSPLACSLERFFIPRSHTPGTSPSGTSRAHFANLG